MVDAAGVRGLWMRIRLCAALEVKIQNLEAARAELRLENQSLKAKLEFAPEVRRPSENIEPGKKGVLDQDLF